MVLLPTFWPNLPPLGISYISEILSLNNIEHDIFDFNIDFYKNSSVDLRKNWTFYDFNSSKYFIQRYLEEKNETISELIFKIVEILKSYNLVGFSLFSTNRYLSIKIIEKLKEINSSIIIIGGGPDLTLNKDIYEKILDIKFYGNAIFEFDNFCKNLSKTFFEKNYCMDYKNENDYSLLQKVFPKFNKIEINKYLRKNCVPIITSFGCIGKCKFCTERLLFGKPILYDSEFLIYNIRYYLEKFNRNWVTFYDSMINIYPLKFKEFLKKLLDFQNNIKFSNKFYWDAQLGIQPFIDDETIELMKRTGCINLFIGLESGSGNVLKKMNKLFNLDDAVDLFNRLNKFNIHFEISLIIGFPGETEDDFNLTLKFLKENKKLIPKIAQINPFIYYPSLKNEIEENEIICKEEVENRYKKIINFIKKENFNFTNEYLGNLII